MEPQPIRTAPAGSEYRPILAYSCQWGWEVMSRGWPGRHCDPCGPHWVTLPGYYRREPTHWVALPAPPRE
jgi:hypothetical protein